MVPLKSSIGEISSKISSRPLGPDRSDRPSASAAATRACHVSLPTNQSKLSTCNASRSGTWRGSEIFAKEMRRGPVTLEMLSDWGLREGTKGRPSTGSQNHIGAGSARQAAPVKSETRAEARKRQRKAIGYMIQASL